MALSLVGSRLRQLRVERGLTQSKLAQSLNISNSYLNQIEHDVRPLTTPVLLRINEVLGVDASYFSLQDDGRLIAQLSEVCLEEDVGLHISPQEITQMVATHPQFAQTMVTLHQRYRNTQDRVSQLTEDHNPNTTKFSMPLTKPHEEIRDYFYSRQNYIDELDTAAESLAERMRFHRGDIGGEIVQRLTTQHGVQIVERIDLGEDTLHSFDPEKKVLAISLKLNKGQRIFKYATELAYLEHGNLITSLVEEGNFSGHTAQALARVGLANYFAAATILPYTQFREIAEDYRYDIERLSSYYMVGYETICHRLSTLQRPQLRGVPFMFVRVDRAGNMSKRQSATSFHFSTSGGTCPLWNVYETFSSPGKIMTQLAQMPDGRRYLWIAKTVESKRQRYQQSNKIFAIGLGCEIRHAHRLVYADGLTLDDSNPGSPIGAGCRICERIECPQRAFPPLGKALQINEHRSGITPYIVH